MQFIIVLIDPFDAPAYLPVCRLPVDLSLLDLLLI